MLNLFPLNYVKPISHAYAGHSKICAETYLNAAMEYTDETPGYCSARIEERLRLKIEKGIIMGGK